MVIHLKHYTAPFLQSNPSLSPINNPAKSILMLKFKKNRRNFNAVEKDSEFEVNPDEAREALRNLDKQLQSLSTKQVGTPKIRATELKQWSYEGEEEDSSDISGSFWAYAAAFLFLFTIFYNILFLTVIKPSIDVPLPLESTDAIKS